jgi:hypothetical protein
LCTTYSTWSGLKSSPDLQEDRLASNCLNHGTVPPVLQHTYTYTYVHVGALASHHYTCHSVCLHSPPSDPSKDTQITNCEPRGRAKEVCHRFLTAEDGYNPGTTDMGTVVKRQQCGVFFSKYFSFPQLVVFHQMFLKICPMTGDGKCSL